MSKCSTSETAGGTGITTRLDRVGALFVLAILAAQAILGPGGSRTARTVVVVVSVITAVVAVLGPVSSSLGSLACAVMCVVAAMWTGLPWQVVLAMALGVFLLLVRFVSRLHPSSGWRARGHVPVAWTLLVGGVTPIGLVAWLLLAKPDLHDIVEGYVPNLPLPVLILGGAAFALVNATLEELLWRGVIQDRLEPMFGVRGAIALQAVSFGLQHAWGFPRGVAGVILAGSWAVMLGLLRRSAGGLLAPVLAHVVADATIAVIILGVVR